MFVSFFFGHALWFEVPRWAQMVKNSPISGVLSSKFQAKDPGGQLSANPLSLLAWRVPVDQGACRKPRSCGIMQAVRHD